MPRLTVIINPISGTGGRADVARRRAEHARSLIERRGLHGDVLLTERAGHAGELTRSALAAGSTTILAWGGDGTVNEVASVLAFGDAALGILPSGSGNGLARELKIPFDPDRAFDIAAGTSIRRIDAGELDGHLFFNVAGIGLDARVAHRFAAGGLERRGFRRYLELTTSELMSCKEEEHTVVTDGTSVSICPLLVAIANGRQYGNGALIAPLARVDDGLLDVVIVGHRTALQAILRVPQVFMGHIARVPAVTMRTAREVEVTWGEPILYHVDGEPFVGGTSLKGRIRPGALNVKVAASG